MQYPALNPAVLDIHRPSLHDPATFAVIMRRFFPFWEPGRVIELPKEFHEAIVLDVAARSFAGFHHVPETRPERLLTGRVEA